jgi:hypothetical protein
MTHDELLEFVNKDIDQGSLAVLEWFPARSLFALRAVIELHRAYQPYKGMTTIYCAVCHEPGSNRAEHWYPTEYPCPTIRAIAEELE